MYQPIPCRSQSMELSDSPALRNSVEDEPSEDGNSTNNSKTQLLTDNDSSAATSRNLLTGNVEPLTKKPRICGKGMRNILALVFVGVFLVVIIVTCLVLTVGGVFTKPKHDRTSALNNKPLVFKGIPYAVPPIGRLRWQPPRSLPERECWGEHVNTYIATDFSPPCTQYDPETKGVIGQEDCLYLNVWTPQYGLQSQLPVMVLFHGGGLMTGSGNDEGFTPSAELAAKTNTVFVSFNYRLNVFGYMSLDVLSRNTSTHVSGNYGLLDQIEALRWIKKNIAYFGGNPDKVTVFGSGSGATSIYALLASQDSHGLFHRAWMASLSPLLDNSSSLAVAQKQNLPFLKNVGCEGSSSQLACLLDKTTEEVIEALDWSAWTNPHFRALPTPNENSTILLTVKGNGLQMCPIDAWKRGEFNDVPLLIGSMAQEVDVDPVPADVTSWNWTMYDDYLRKKLVAFDDEYHLLADDVISLYPHEISPEYQMTSMVSDIRYIIPLSFLTNLVSPFSRSPVYRYVSNFIPSNRALGANQNYAYRGMDVQAFMGHFTNDTDTGLHEYSGILQDTVMEFVREGKLAKWNPHSMLILSDRLQAQNEGYKEEKHNFWNTQGFIPLYAGRN